MQGYQQGSTADALAPTDGTAENAVSHPTRRQLVRIVLQGAALPAMYSALGADEVRAREAHGVTTGNSVVSSRAKEPTARLVRDFRDPYLELMRLLHVAAEIEHGLMVQYLYGAFSVKPTYQALAGYGAPGSNDLIGIAVQEMQHLAKVNRLIVALGGAPTLINDEFPYEPDIMPFRLRLEPLSRLSLAKYAWTESPVGATDLRQAHSEEDRKFCKELDVVLGKDKRPNFVGSLYGAVIDVLKELDATKDRSLPALQSWVPVLKEIKDEGEVGHYQFFRKAFLATHESFGTHHDAWSRPVSDPLYPAYQLPISPTAYIGHNNQIKEGPAQRLAWLGNMHYWVVLSLLSTGYSVGSQEMVGLARGHMMGPFLSLARQLAKMGSGMPFDPLGQGYQASTKNAASIRFIRHLLNEADRLEKEIGSTLPSDFAGDFCRGTMAALTSLESVVRSARAPTQPWDYEFA